MDYLLKLLSSGVGLEGRICILFALGRASFVQLS